MLGAVLGDIIGSHYQRQRVDELKNGQLRLSVWAKGRKGRKERTISEEPDIVVCGGTEIAPNCYKFEYKDTKFQINLDRLRATPHICSHTDNVS